MNIPETYSCNEITAEPTDQNLEDNEFIKRHPTVFNGLGDIKGSPVNIKLKPGSKPYRITTPRHVPIPLYQAVMEEIKRMEKLGVIRKIEEPTDWCHPIVAVVKPKGDIRLCIDLTKLNNGIERELYQLESVHETIARIGDECHVMTPIQVTGKCNSTTNLNCYYIYHTIRKILLHTRTLLIKLHAGNF